MLTIWQEIQCLAGGIAQGIWRALEKQEDLVTDLMDEGIPVPKGSRRRIRASASIVKKGRGQIHARHA